MSPVRRVLGSPFRGVAKIFAMLRYDPAAYGTGSSDRRAGETNMRSAEDTMRHGAVNMNLGDMGNNAI